MSAASDPSDKGKSVGDKKQRPSTSAASQPIEASQAGPSTLPDPKTDLSAYLLRLQSSLQPLTRHAATLPSHGDLAFHRSMDRKLGKKLDVEADRILDSISTLAEWIASDSHAPKIPLLSDSDTLENGTKGKGKLKLEQAQVTTKESFTSNLGELVDHLLESADTCLDEYAGKLAPRNLNLGNDAAASKNGLHDSKALPKVGPLPPRILNANITPPQRTFTTKPDNASDRPWSPRNLKYGKPNALVPIGHQNVLPTGPDGQPLPRGPRRGMYCAEGDPLDHPYYYEILHSEPPAHALSKPDPKWKDHPPPPINEKDPSLSTDSSPFQWVTTKAQIEALKAHLEEDRVKEIAIDLEHHSFRTYQGIVCLMQLSTRWGDWIIDTLSDEVREHAELLNTTFTDPAKVKVLHGANHDVLWLQRDLGLYLVNLFDTYHATNVLMFPSHGLNYLMARYCNFDADKRYQLADWRIRPLPKEMMYYARSDTHTLLYIYDHLRHELMESGGVQAIKEVFVRSKDVANSVYAKEEWDESGESREGWRSVWRKWGGEAALGTETRTELKDMKKEERLVRALHKWRDGVARQEDESPRYILGANNLVILAVRAPITKDAVLSCIPVHSKVLKSRVQDIATLIAAEVEAWEQDQRDKNQKSASMDEDMTVEQPSAFVASAHGSDTPSSEQINISAISQVTTSDPAIDVSVWQSNTHAVAQADVTARSDATVAPAPEQRKSRFGAMRSLAQGLFGRAKSSDTITTAPASIAAVPDGVSNAMLSANASKLFGSGSMLGLPSQSSSSSHVPNNKAAHRVENQIQDIKSGFLQEIGSVFGVSTTSADQKIVVDDGGDESMQEMESNTTPRVDQEMLTSFTSDADKTQAKEGEGDVHSDRDDDDADKREEYIIIGDQKKKSKSSNKTKKRKSTDSISNNASTTSTGSSAGMAPARKKGKFEAEYDFTSTPAAASSSTTSAIAVQESKEKHHASPTKPSDSKTKSKSKSKSDKKKSSSSSEGSNSKISENIFRQPRDRARRKTGMGGTM